MNSARRIQKEFEKMQEEKIPGIEAQPCSADLFHWHASLTGPEGSPYEGGTFELDIRLPARYPLEPPLVKFRTPVFHPNINNRGDICLDVLKQQWSPALSLQKVLLSISSLLTDPNCADPLDSAAAALFRQDHASYDARCREMTRQFAMPSVPGTKRKAVVLTSASAAGQSPARPKAKAKAKPKAATARVATAKAQAKTRAKARGRAA